MALVTGWKSVKKTDFGLRLRVALAFTVVFSLIVSVFGITLHLSASEIEDTMVDQMLDGEANYLIERLRADPRMIAPSGSQLKTWIVRTPAETASLPKYLQHLGPGQHEVFPGGKEIHITVRDADGGTTGARVYLAYDVSLNEQRLEHFKWLIALCVFAVIVISLTASYWLAGVLLKQVTDLARAVDQLHPGAYPATLSRAGQEEEVARLARAFDNYQQRLADVLRREQEFTADASHELRTPLTAIRTSCELLAADAALNGKSRERIGVIDKAARHMGAQLEALLFLAREQPLAGSEPVNIAECAHEAAAPYRDEIEQRGVRMHVDVAPGAVLNASYEALHLVLSNLLRNAVRHTQNGSVRVELRGNRLSVADTGSGITPEDLPHVFERLYRGSGAGTEGTGLGLAIVKRICDQSGWSIAVDSVPGRGSTFTVVFEDLKIP